jgi:hypothetical protein
MADDDLALPRLADYGSCSTRLKQGGSKRLHR